MEHVLICVWAWPSGSRIPPICTTLAFHPLLTTALSCLVSRMLLRKFRDVPAIGHGLLTIYDLVYLALLRVVSLYGAF